MRSGSAAKSIPWIALMWLGLAAAVQALIGLGDLPLRDFDEATVAQVALELRHGVGEAPLLPTLWDQPYLNKAPGLHILIALVISATTRASSFPQNGQSAWRRHCCLPSSAIRRLAAMVASPGRSLQHPCHQRDFADAAAGGPSWTPGDAGWHTA